MWLILCLLVLPLRYADGTTYARNHSSEDFSSPILPDVPTCILTMDQRCEEYFTQKADCETGIDLANSSKTCNLKINNYNCTLLTHLSCAYGATVTKKSCKPPHNPCQHECNVNGVQVKCSCRRGYQLMADGKSCEDIDECITGEAKCGPLQICTNLHGGYTCSCPAGHRLIGDHQCEDVDECALSGSVPMCSKNAECVNTIGSYQCRCHEGFESAPANDKVCVDVDECSGSYQGSLCQQLCNNVWGGYWCSCHRGYRLNADNRTCYDVDECTEFKHKTLCIGWCQNEPGSYRCSCPSGYRLPEDKRSCIDINECETSEAPCAHVRTLWAQPQNSTEVCLNTRGSFRCYGITCPHGYRLEQKNRCTKIQQSCPPSDWECAHQPNIYSYNFITFVSNLYIPESKVDLFTMRGPASPAATMLFQLRVLNVDAPPSVKEKADINSFLLVQIGPPEAVISLVKPLQGPQSIELELSMEMFKKQQFGGMAVAKIYIHVSEFEF